MNPLTAVLDQAVSESNVRIEQIYPVLNLTHFDHLTDAWSDLLDGTLSADLEKLLLKEFKVKVKVRDSAQDVAERIIAYATDAKKLGFIVAFSFPIPNANGSYSFGCITIRYLYIDALTDQTFFELAELAKKFHAEYVEKAKAKLKEKK